MSARTAPPPSRAGAAAAEAGDFAPSVDVGELARIARRRLRLLPLCLAIAGAIALAYIVVTPTRYLATMSILVDPRERTPVGLDAPPMPQNPDIALVESEMRILTSKAVLRRLAQAQNLAADPEFQPGVATMMFEALTGLMRPSAGDADARLEGLVEALGKRISVKRDERNYILDVELRASTPDRAERLARGLADAFFAEQTSLGDDIVAKQSAWLDQRIETLRGQVDAAERRAQDYREANSIVLSDGRISPDQQLKDANSALVVARGKRAEAEAQSDQVKAAFASPLAGGVGEALRSPVIEKLRADQAALGRDEAYELSTLGPRHPSYLTTRLQLESVQTQIDAELKRIRASSERDLKAARAAEQDAAKLVATLEATNQQFGDRQIELDRLDSDSKTLRASYEKALSARENVRRDIIETPHSTLVDPPSAEIGRVSPRARLALFLALVAGLNLWLVAAFAAEYRERRGAVIGAGAAAALPPARNAAAAAAPTLAQAAAPSAPVAFDLATPAFVAPAAGGEGDDAATLAAAEAAMTGDPRYGAAIAAIRDRLAARFPRETGGARVVAIVARARGEGASVVALSLAHAFSAAGERALLVDCDHRRPSLSSFARRLRKVIVDQPGQVASILTREPGSGGEALILPLGGPGARVLSARLQQRFDWILLDCGPLSGVGALLAHEKTADAVVIVDASGADAETLAGAAEREGVGALVAGIVRSPARGPGSKA
jgi:succinoglycan biosynthesis transport protein ExoP